MIYSRISSALEASGEIDTQAIREILKSGRQEIAERFHEGESARTLIRERSNQIDALLRGIWKQIGPDSPHTALIAVGGYGRRELHPFSDIDLMILTEAERDPAIDHSIGAFITLLWDLGLEIGHSVRSSDECVREGLADITVTTNLLEARLLAGPEKLFNRLQERFTDDAIWPSGPFFVAKRNEQEARLIKYNDTAYNLEPNIKEGPGGLRDIQNILWVTRRHFGSGDLSELVDHHFLTAAECADLEAGQERLWEVRFALHLIAGRAEERLLFEHQPALAAHFGHLDNEKNRGVESFMHSYFRIIRELSLLNEMLLQLFEEQLLTPDKERVPVSINDHFGVSGGYLTLHNRGTRSSNPDELSRHPELILPLFLALRDHPQVRGVTAETIRQIRSARHAITPDFRNNHYNQQLFLQLFQQPEGMTHTLRRMNRYGILGAYLPEFERIVGLMQYDLFHAYTVDEHTLFVIRNLRRLTVAEFHNESPLLSKLILQLPHPEQLYLAALFHDIAKGRGGDHSTLGGEIAREFCLRHGLSPESSSEIVWLVNNHLIMSTFAQRRDLDDPTEIESFAHMVGKQSRLDMLYLLTVADIRATNSTLWNHFKDSLLYNLYQLASTLLAHGARKPVTDDHRLLENRDQALEILATRSIARKEVERLWENLEEEYFQKHDAREISWHTESILKASELPIIELHQESHLGGTEIFIYSEDRQFLFPILVHALEYLGLDIQAAKINTTLDSHALDIFTVLDQNGETIQGESLISRIVTTLRKEIANPTLLAQPVTFRRTRHQKHFHEQSKVHFRQDERRQQTILEVHATDRSGLLSTICRVLMGCNIRVHGAKIATLGEKIEDLFWVTHQDNTPLANDAFNQDLSRQIRQALDPQ